MLELVFRVCVRQRKKMGAGISGGGPPWAHEVGGRTQGGRARPPPSWPGGSSPAVIFALKILKYSRKNHIKLAWHSEDFYFRDIFILHG